MGKMLHLSQQVRESWFRASLLPPCLRGASFCVPQSRAEPRDALLSSFNVGALLEVSL